MPALNFKKRFAPEVVYGRKKQTIRAKREDGRNPRPGDTLFLFTGQRTKYCQRLGTVDCKSVEEITIYPNSKILIAGKPLNDKEKDKLAVRDGFHDFPEFMAFFRKEHDLPLWGLLIKW